MLEIGAGRKKSSSLAPRPTHAIEEDQEVKLMREKYQKEEQDEIVCKNKRREKEKKSEKRNVGDLIINRWKRKDLKKKTKLRNKKIE